MDALDDIKAQWAKQRPDLNTDPMALIGRLMRIAEHLSQEMGKTFAAHGLNGASFDVLATLLRSGPPHALTPNDLLSTMMITSGTLTNRIDRLVAAGLVRRDRTDGDGRSVTISLTPQGLWTIDAAVTDHVKTQTRLVSRLTSQDQAALNALLGPFLQDLTGS